VLDQQVIDEEGPFVLVGLVVDPELLLGDVGIPVVLAEIRELLVEVSANVGAVDHPDLVVAARFVSLQIGGLERIRHGAFSLR
jgi:hypothetical protein